VNVAGDVGLERVIWCGRPGKDHLLDSTGTGAAFLDYDCDGKLDIYVVNAWKLDGGEIIERGSNALYRGQADGTFQDVTSTARVDGQGHWGSGVFVADYDADGWPDILVTNFGPTLLYRNLGDGRFEEVAGKLGIAAPGWYTGAAFFDADHDDDLDLYLAAYVDCSEADVRNARRTLDWKGVDKVAFGPFGLTGASDHFYLSEAGTKFIEVTERAGMVDKALGFGFAVRAADYDNDGDSDLYVANDSDANYLYRNEGDGVFKEVALWTGCSLSRTGAAQASMGVAVGDVDGNGALDIFTSNFSEDSSTFFRAVAPGIFEDATVRFQLAQPTFHPLSWGTALADLDNDSDLDLVVTNGHIYPQVDQHPELGFTYAQRNQVFENRAGRFVDVTGEAGPGFQLVQSSRGLAIGDYDNDGDLDLLITNLDTPPVLLRNETAADSWLTVVCEVPAGVGTAIGARVSVTLQGRTLIRDLAVGDSFLSTHDPRLHFGLGEAEVVDKVDVQWPDGSRTTRTEVKARQFLTMRKGT
jgi:hypothetical protein